MSVQLGSHDETAPISETAVSNDIMQEVYHNTNMETFDFNRALEREYPLASFTWDVTEPSGNRIKTYAFPELLFNQSFISDKIKDFRLFRGGLRLTFKNTANRFLYGKLLICYEPLPDLDQYNLGSNKMHEASGYPHVLLSASSSESVVFDVPFISQKRFLDISDYANNEMGTFHIFVLNPLTDINGTIDTAEVFVTAQFIDAELMLPHDQFTVQSKSESYNKSSKGVISSMLEETTPISSALTNLPLIGPYADIYTAGAKTTAQVMRMLGLSKPTTSDITQVSKINPFSDICYGKGIDTSIKMSMDPENQISTEPVVGGINMDEMKLTTVVGMPQLSNIVSFLPGSSQLRVVSASPFETESTFVDFVSRNFEYLSGTYKIKIYITASLFHNVRGVFWLCDSEDSTDWANCYHKVVDIQGDTEVEFTIPYCPSLVSQRTQSGYQVFGINFTVLTWSQPDNVISAPIHLNVYKAGDTDFKFGGLKETAFLVQSNPRSDFKNMFKPFHESFKGYGQTNLLYGEEYTTLREVLHRFAAIKQASSIDISAWSQSGNLSNNLYTGMELFALLFRFYRGSIRMKLINSNPATTQAAIFEEVVDSSTVVYYGTNISSTTNPLIEVELPYYSNQLMLPTTPGGIVQGRKLKTTDNGSFIFTSAGDDFSLHFLRGVPPGSFQPLSVGEGYAGFITYMNG